jgi:sugar porter (SP) family MFS transporter
MQATTHHYLLSLHTSLMPPDPSEIKGSSALHVENTRHVFPAEINVRLGDYNATRTMVLFSIWISISAWISVFDFSYGGLVLTMPSFKRSFGNCQSTGQATEDCELSAIQQSLMSITSIFIAVGGASGGLLATFLGRRGTMQVGSLITAIGAAGMLGTAGNYTNYMACKCIGATGIGLLYSSAPIYGAECVFPKHRGFLLALFNVGQALGSLTAAGICLGTAYLPSDWAWKTPIACQIPLGVAFAATLFYFPESPRWLVLKTKHTLARNSLSRFYHMEPNCDTINQQLDTIQNHLQAEEYRQKYLHAFEIFRPYHIRRTFVSALILVGLAISGIAFITPYATLFLANVGVNNPYLVNVYIGLCTLAGALVGPALIEFAGRRLTMISGYTGMGLCMLIFAAVNTAMGEDNQAAQRVLVAFVCIWSFIFGGSIGPASWVASPEMHSVGLRTYGQAFSTAIYQIFSFAASFWSPYMLNIDYGNMGTNVGYFYFGVSVVMLILIFSFMPETSRLTLEQVDDYFQTGRPAWKTSLRQNKQVSSGLQPSDSEMKGML